jgi:hypothetical protein
MSVFPITFSIPKEKIIKCIPEKTKIISNLIPGKLDTYIYNNETEYYNEYRTSFFATTTKKAGWDCMRHYEILANGCIPYFPNIENCPENTMALLPKKLIIQGNELYEKYKNKNINDISIEEKDELNNLISNLLNYTRDYLSTDKIAKYILEKTNHSGVKNVLYLSQNIFPDYLRCVTLHGFKEILGENCHDYPKVPHLYKKDEIDYYLNYYGRGFTYTNLLDETSHNYENDSSIERDIQSKKYDIVIYGSLHRGIPYYDLVSQYYKPNEIIILCGEDCDNGGERHTCVYNDFIGRGNNVFVREL